MACEQAFQTFRYAVNLKFPPELGGRRSRRQINEISGCGHKSGQGGRGERGGKRGQGNRGGRGRSKRRMDSTTIILTDGKEIEYRTSFSYPPDIYTKMKPEDMETLCNQRMEYKRQLQVQSVGQ